MNAVSDNHDLVDPDPATIVGLAISLVGAIAPLVQIFRKQPPTELTVHVHQQMPLAELERSIETAQSHIKALQRSVDRGSPDAESQFYDAPSRILETSLEIDTGHFDTYVNSTISIFASAGNISMWIMNITRHHPQLASRLGQKLDKPIQEIANQLNLLMEQGQPVRQAIAELKSALSALALAIEDELSRNQGN